MRTPELKQYTEFCHDDFVRHPIWVCVHGIDEDEPWYGATDALTYRPWLRSTPYHCGDETAPDVVVFAEFRLSDNSRLSGFTRPPLSSNSGHELSYTQPNIFLPLDGFQGFWLGMRNPTLHEKQHFYAAIGKVAAEVFPIAFSPVPGLIDVEFVGRIPGFSYLSRTSEPFVEG